MAISEGGLTSGTTVHKKSTLKSFYHVMKARCFVNITALGHERSQEAWLLRAFACERAKAALQYIANKKIQKH